MEQCLLLKGNGLDSLLTPSESQRRADEKNARRRVWDFENE